MLEQGPGRGRQRVDPVLDLGDLRRIGGDRSQAADARGARGQGLGHGAHGPQSLGGLPRQRETQQPVEGGRHRPLIGVDELSESGRTGLTDDDEGIKDTELAPRQLVERAQYR